MLQQLNVVDDSCKFVLVLKEKGWHFEHKSWHFKGVPRRQSHRRSGLATLPSVGAGP